MHKPKLVILLSRFPYPLEKGDKLRAYNQIKSLHAHFDIHLIALTQQAILPEHQQQVAPYVNQIHIIQQAKWKNYLGAALGLFKAEPLQVSYYYQSKTQQQINAIINAIQPAIVYVQLARMAKYVLHLPYKKVLDYQDAFSLNYARSSKYSKLPLRFIYTSEANRMAKYEKKVLVKFDAATIISTTDQLHIDSKIQVVRNGVDTNYFVAQQQTKQYDLLFVGNLGYAPNVLAVEFIVLQLLPKLIVTNPTITIAIAGANPSTTILAYQSKHIKILPWLPDIRDAYAVAKIFIAPLFTGAGLQNKLLEAMSMQLPCITTTICNDALHAIPNQQVLIADSADAFVSHIISLMKNKEHCNTLANQGRQLVVTQFDWQSANAILAQLLTSIINKG
jgi:polysaccharide biosynthesis protein PslH